MCDLILLLGQVTRRGLYVLPSSPERVLSHHASPSLCLSPYPRQVPGVGVQGICRQLHSGGAGDESPASLGPPMLVRFGSLGFIKGCLPSGSLAVERLEHTAEMQRR